MDKKKNRRNDDDYEYEDKYEIKDKQDRRKMKRIKNALRSKNIDDLMSWEDE